MLRQIGTVGVAALALVVGACGDDEGPDNVATQFTATMSGTAERPDPVTTNASGTATVTVNESNSTLTYNVTVANIVDATLAHIHVGGTDEAGPPVVVL